MNQDLPNPKAPPLSDERDSLIESMFAKAKNMLWPPSPQVALPGGEPFPKGPESGTLLRQASDIESMPDVGYSTPINAPDDAGLSSTTSEPDKPSGIFNSIWSMGESAMQTEGFKRLRKAARTAGLSYALMNAGSDSINQSIQMSTLPGAIVANEKTREERDAEWWARVRRREYETPVPADAEQNRHFDEGGDVAKPSQAPASRDDTKGEAFKKWFGEGDSVSKIADDQGLPKRVYHGTTKDFDAFDRSKGLSVTDKIGSWFAETPEFASARLTHQNTIAGSRQGPMPKGARIIPAHLNVKNPLEVETRQQLDEHIEQNVVMPEKVFERYKKQLAATFTELADPDDPEGLRKKLSVFDRYYSDDAARAQVNKYAISMADGPDELLFADLARQAMADYDGVSIADDQGYGKAFVAFEPNQIKSAIANEGTYDPADPRIHKDDGGVIPATNSPVAIPSMEPGGPAEPKRSPWVHNRLADMVSPITENSLFKKAAKLYKYYSTATALAAAMSGGVPNAIKDSMAEGPSEPQAPITREQKLAETYEKASRRKEPYKPKPANFGEADHYDIGGVIRKATKAYHHITTAAAIATAASGGVPDAIGESMGTSPPNPPITRETRVAEEFEQARRRRAPVRPKPVEKGEPKHLADGGPVSEQGDFHFERTGEGQGVFADASPEELEAAHLYQNTPVYGQMQGYLRGTSDNAGWLSKMWHSLTTPKQAKQAISGMDSLMGKSSLPEMTVHRAMVIPEAGEDNRDIEKLPGKTITEPGFASTSVDPASIENFMVRSDRVRGEIHVPSGSQGVSLHPDDTGIKTKWAQEKEILLPRGSSFKVDEVDRDPDQRWRVKMDLLPKDEPSELRRDGQEALADVQHAADGGEIAGTREILAERGEVVVKPSEAKKPENRAVLEAMNADRGGVPRVGAMSADVPTIPGSPADKTDGGEIHQHLGTPGKDNEPVKVAEEAFVVNAGAAQKPENKEILQSINAGTVPHFDGGGEVNASADAPKSPVEHAVATWRALYDRVTDPKLTYPEIDATIAEPFQDLTIAQLKEVGAGIGKTIMPGSKAKMVAQFVRMVKDQKENWERLQPRTPHMAEGGPVSTPIKATAGEFMVSPEPASRFRPLLNAINNDQTKTTPATSQHLATGGAVDAKKQSTGWFGRAIGAIGSAFGFGSTEAAEPTEQELPPMAAILEDDEPTDVGGVVPYSQPKKFGEHSDFGAGLMDLRDGPAPEMPIVKQLHSRRDGQSELRSFLRKHQPDGGVQLISHAEAFKKMKAEEERGRQEAEARQGIFERTANRLGFAEGGEIPEVKGIPRDADEVPVDAQPGAFVVRKEQASKFKPVLQAIENDQMPADVPQHLDRGGDVEAKPHTAPSRDGRAFPVPPGTEPAAQSSSPSEPDRHGWFDLPEVEKDLFSLPTDSVENKPSEPSKRKPDLQYPDLQKPDLQKPDLQIADATSEPVRMGIPALPADPAMTERQQESHDKEAYYRATGDDFLADSYRKANEFDANQAAKPGSGPEPAVSGPAVSGPAVSGPAVSGPAEPTEPVRHAIPAPPVDPLLSHARQANRDKIDFHGAKGNTSEAEFYKRIDKLDADREARPVPMAITASPVNPSMPEERQKVRDEIEYHEKTGNPRKANERRSLDRLMEEASRPRKPATPVTAAVAEANAEQLERRAKDTFNQTQREGYEENAARWRAQAEELRAAEAARAAEPSEPNVGQTEDAGPVPEAIRADDVPEVRAAPGRPLNMQDLVGGFKTANQIMGMLPKQSRSFGVPSMFDWGQNQDFHRKVYGTSFQEQPVQSRNGFGFGSGFGGILGGQDPAKLMGMLGPLLGGSLGGNPSPSPGGNDGGGGAEGIKKVAMLAASVAFPEAAPILRLADGLSSGSGPMPEHGGGKDPLSGILGAVGGADSGMGGMMSMLKGFIGEGNKGGSGGSGGNGDGSIAELTRAVLDLVNELKNDKPGSSGNSPIGNVLGEASKVIGGIDYAAIAREYMRRGR